MYYYVSKFMFFKLNISRYAIASLLRCFVFSYSNTLLPHTPANHNTFLNKTSVIRSCISSTYTSFRSINVLLLPVIYLTSLFYCILTNLPLTCSAIALASSGSKIISLASLRNILITVSNGFSKAVMSL